MVGWGLHEKHQTRGSDMPEMLIDEIQAHSPPILSEPEIRLIESGIEIQLPTREILDDLGREREREKKTKQEFNVIQSCPNMHNA